MGATEFCFNSTITEGWRSIALSIEKRGTFLYVFVNGRPAAELQIDRRVSDGKLYLSSGLTTNDLALMRKDWPLIGQRKK